ncbi:MAG TPA: tetratricopeptide repeat protein [Pirellulaceae bacterium]|nr:tetratricopeptide repeat protein [Pirellulaceae bacterium]
MSGFLAAHVLRASAYHSLGKWRECCEDATSAIELVPENIQGYLLRASALKERERNDDALLDVEHALARDAQSAPAWFLRAELHMAIGNYGDAISDYDEVLLLDGQNAWALFRRACGSVELDNHGKSSIRRKHALQGLPGEPRHGVSLVAASGDRTQAGNFLNGGHRSPIRRPNPNGRHRRRVNDIESTDAVIRLVT